MAAGRYAGGSSNPPETFEHQVFLSFRGTDTRIFVAHLFSALKKAGVRVFLDNDGLEHGRGIQLKLYNAIHHSEMSVVILSLGYADSRWCLDELAKIMELHKSKTHSVLPVFFDVEPTVVRNQTRAYMGAFKMLEKRFGGEIDRVKKWRWALNQVASLRGLSLDADSYYKYDGSVAAIARLFSRAIPVRALDFGYVGTSEGFSRLNSDSLLSPCMGSQN
uniref:TIR domain-containing protein n=1 Tax=Kalanchoe fedtschenkoi TaxID=63787 RepID=A0A7N0TA04_KALFE